MRYQTEPMSMLQLRKCTGKNNRIKNIHISISLYDIIKSKFDDFYRLVSQKVTGTDLLADIRTEAIGVTDNGEIILEIGGDVSEILANDDAKNGIVNAEVEFQTENNGYCHPVTTAEFNCRPILDLYDLDELPSDGNFLAPYYYETGDKIYHYATCMNIAPDWNGPFDFNIKDVDAYLDYYKRRNLAENA